MVKGLFTPSPDAASFSKAPHFAKSEPVLVRFSDATGIPNLPDDAFTDIVSISANGFPVATPEDFLALLRAAAQSGPDASKPTPIETFLGTHPAAVKFVTLGTLSLSHSIKDQVATQKSIMFSPLNLQAGIEPSADPVLLARPSPYGVSYSQRIR